MTDTMHRGLPRESVDKLIANLVDVPEIEGYPWSELLHTPWPDLIRLEQQLKFDITGIMRDVENPQDKSLAWRSAATGALRIKQHQITGVRALRRMRQEDAFADKHRQVHDKELVRLLHHVARMVRVWLVISDDADRVLIEDALLQAVDRIPDDKPLDPNVFVAKLREQVDQRGDE